MNVKGQNIERGTTFPKNELLSDIAQWSSTEGSG